MKQYLDLTAVAHQTFKYTSKGPVDLLEGKKALHIQAAGSEYHRSGKWGIVKFLVRKASGIQSKESCALQDLGDTYLTNMRSSTGSIMYESYLLKALMLTMTSEQRF